MVRKVVAGWDGPVAGGYFLSLQVQFPVSPGRWSVA